MNQTIAKSLLVLAFAGASVNGQESYRSWATCHMVEGKGGGCTAGDRPRQFNDFLEPRFWAKDRYIGAEVWFDISQMKTAPPRGKWKDIGSLGSHRVRVVHLGFADVILIEGSPGIFSPLMKWSGQMPIPSIHQFGGESVLVLDKDWGGNVHMVQTWAWAWSPGGPRQIDVAGAVASAIEKVAPGHSSYPVGIDWATLQTQTWTWAGDYPGKLGVEETVKIRFELKNGAFLPARVEFSNMAGQIKVWPADGK